MPSTISHRVFCMWHEMHVRPFRCLDALYCWMGLIVEGLTQDMVASASFSQVLSWIEKIVQNAIF